MTKVMHLSKHARRDLPYPEMFQLFASLVGKSESKEFNIFVSAY
jgi:hypothetical protein